MDARDLKEVNTISLYSIQTLVLDAATKHALGQHIEAIKCLRTASVGIVAAVKTLAEECLVDNDEDGFLMSLRAACKSPDSGRPEGWKTVVEYLSENDAQRLTAMRNMATETSGLGVKCAKLAYETSVKPFTVPAPSIFTDEHESHFDVVRAYPVSILKEIIG